MLLGYSAFHHFRSSLYMQPPPVPAYVDLVVYRKVDAVLVDHAISFPDISHLPTRFIMWHIRQKPQAWQVWFFLVSVASHSAHMLCALCVNVGISRHMQFRQPRHDSPALMSWNMPSLELHLGQYLGCGFCIFGLAGRSILSAHGLHTGPMNIARQNSASLGRFPNRRPQFTQTMSGLPPITLSSVFSAQTRT